MEYVKGRFLSNMTNYLTWSHQETKNKPKKQIMTIEEYKAQVFKYDAKGPVTIGDEWPYLTRATRREIERLVKKGKQPDFLEYI